MTASIRRAPRGLHLPHLSRPAALLFLAGTLFGAMATAAPAAAQWIPRGFIFDRLLWSDDGKSLGVVGRYWNDTTPESFEDTLLVDPATGRYECVSPSVVEFIVSRDGERVLFRGRWGLYDHELRTGRTQELLSIHPFHPNQLLQLSYNRDRSAALAIRCSDWEPEAAGVWAFPLDGGPPERVLADESCGPPAFNYFQSHRRDIPPTQKRVPGRDRPVNPAAFPGTVWMVPQPGGKNGVAVWGNGAAGSDTLCLDCNTEFVSWKSEAGPLLIAVGPNARGDVTTPGALWLVGAGAEPVSIGAGRWDSCVWPDSSWAFVLARPGRLEVVDAESRTLRPVNVSRVPDWLRASMLVAPDVWTVRLEGEVFATADSAMSLARPLKSGYALDPVDGGSGWVLSLGAHTDEAAARTAAERLKAERFRGGAVREFRVERRPVSRMLGEFEFGEMASPDGAFRAFFRTHAHLYEPYMTTELWIEPKGGRPRPVLEGMGSF